VSSRKRKTTIGHVYLIHFERRFKHAGHYLGWADDLDQRLAQHRSGNGARLMEVISHAGIAWKVVRTWRGDRTFERLLKRRKNAPRRLCPVCRGVVHYDAVLDGTQRIPGSVPDRPEADGGDYHPF
jgi:predicted GIY-YIG superfamily endonuclease